MKKVLITIARIVAFLVAAYLIFAFLILGGIPGWVSASFASKAVLRYHYGGKAIDRVIADQDDLNALKSILRGWTVPEGEMPGLFDSDISITMVDGSRRIVFLPACDTSSFFKIGGTNRCLYISETRMDKFHDIVGKYGMIFPCL